MCLVNVCRWLDGHSFFEKAGRTLSVTRTILDELSPSQFIWQPYSTDILASLPPYCLTGQHIWRYRGPMICVFIVETHVPDRVARQFGMLQAIPRDVVYTTAHHKMTLKGNSVINWTVRHQGSIDIWNNRSNNIFQSELIDGDGTTSDYLDWYLQRTVRFISRVGALHVYLVSTLCFYFPFIVRL